MFINNLLHSNTTPTTQNMFISCVRRTQIHNEYLLPCLSLAGIMALTLIDANWAATIHPYSSLQSIIVKVDPWNSFKDYNIYNHLSRNHSLSIVICLSRVLSIVAQLRSCLNCITTYSSNVHNNNSTKPDFRDWRNSLLEVVCRGLTGLIVSPSGIKHFKNRVLGGTDLSLLLYS